MWPTRSVAGVLPIFVIPYGGGGYIIDDNRGATLLCHRNPCTLIDLKRVFSNKVKAYCGKGGSYRKNGNDQVELVEHFTGFFLLFAVVPFCVIRFE